MILVLLSVSANSPLALSDVFSIRAASSSVGNLMKSPLLVIFDVLMARHLAHKKDGRELVGWTSERREGKEAKHQSIHQSPFDVAYSHRESWTCRRTE